MRWQPTVVVALFAVCLMPAAHAQEVVEPAAFIKDWAAAFNDNRAAKQSEFYDRSDDTELIVSSGLRHRGYKTIEQGYEKDQEHLRYYDSAARKITSRVLGDTAIVVFEHRIKIHFREDNSRWRLRVRTTSVLRREGNTWRIALEHSSPIHGVERMTRLEEGK